MLVLVILKIKKINKLLDKIVASDALQELKEIPDNSIDLIISSPPYNIGKEYEIKKALEIYLNEKKQVLQECVRVLKDSGSIFWQVGSYSNNGILIPLDIKFFPILENLGMYPRNRIIWARQHGLHASTRFSGRHETILWFTKSNNYKFNLDHIRVPQKYQNKKSYRGENKGKFSCNPNGKNPGDIWVFRNVKHNHEEQTIHPAQFPEDMIARIVLCSTDSGGVVLDPYMGVGTVAVVSSDYGRHFIGFDLEQKYVNVALRRLSGEPDNNNSFPNLKTLREYIKKTCKSIRNYRFDMQIGEKATEQHQAKIFSEEYHSEELFERLSFEEQTFAAKIKNEELPDDNGLIHKPKLSFKAGQATHFHK